VTDTSIQLFTNEDFGSIRALAIDNEPWFVAKDVCDALGIRTSTVRSILDEDEVGEANVNSIDIGPDSGGRAPLIITEAGLYSLVLKSRKPEAKAFKRWVTHDVLPSIRRHGIYATPQTVEDMLADPDTMIATLRALKAERQRAQALLEDNARMLPKSVAYDSIIETEGTMTVTQAARYLAQMDSGINRKRLYGYLRADGIICKVGKAPTKRAIQQGLARQIMSERSNGKANEPYARLTQKGLDWCIQHYVKLPAQMRT